MEVKQILGTVWKAPVEQKLWTKWADLEVATKFGIGIHLMFPFLSFPFIVGIFRDARSELQSYSDNHNRSRGLCMNKDRSVRYGLLVSKFFFSSILYHSIGDSKLVQLWESIGIFFFTATVYSSGFQPLYHDTLVCYGWSTDVLQNFGKGHNVY